MIETFIGSAFVFGLMFFVFIVLPVGLASGTKEDKQLREWRIANGYEFRTEREYRNWRKSQGF